MKYILNSAVITTPGTYQYWHITIEEAKKWLKEDPILPLSTIGYPETAKALSLLAGCIIAVNRLQIFMSSGDEALIFRLTCRLDNPKLKGNLTVEFVLENCEIGILRKE